MTVIAGRCEFSEANGRARVFALCELQDDPILVPMSVAGDTAIRGMQCMNEEYRLVLGVSRLPTTMLRIYVGLRVPQNLDLSEGGPYSLALKLNSGEIKNMPLPTPPSGVRSRYAVMAVMTRSGPIWNVGALVAGPEYYVDRLALGDARPVPPWWAKQA